MEKIQQIPNINQEMLDTIAWYKSNIDEIITVGEEDATRKFDYIINTIFMGDCDFVFNQIQEYIIQQIRKIVPTQMPFIRDCFRSADSTRKNRELDKVFLRVELESITHSENDINSLLRLFSTSVALKKKQKEFNSFVKSRTR